MAEMTTEAAAAIGRLVLQVRGDALRDLATVSETLASLVARCEALQADAERWQRFSAGSFELPNGETVKTHINVGVNVWRGERWIAFHECSPDEFDAAIDRARGEGK